MYKSEIKIEIVKLINNFFIEERGNRITTNNIEGLLMKINVLLRENEIQKKEK